MYREIKKKKLILERRRPFRKETAELIREMTETDWIWSDLRLEGGQLNREQVRRVLKGELIPELPLLEHGMISNFQAMINLAHGCAEMKDRLTEPLLRKLYGAYNGEMEPSYRTDNPVLRMLNYNPPHFHEVSEQMTLLFHWLREAEQEDNPFDTAARLHDRLAEIYPFGENSFLMARASARYFLMSGGFPAPAWNPDEQAYYDGLKQYLKTGSSTASCDILLRGVYNKTEVMMQLTAEQQ